MYKHVTGIPVDPLKKAFTTKINCPIAMATSIGSDAPAHMYGLVAPFAARAIAQRTCELYVCSDPESGPTVTTCYFF